MKRTSAKWLLAAGALALIISAPSTAAPTAGSALLVTKSFSYKGYEWTLIATDGQSGKPDSLTIFSQKKSGSGSQSHSWSFGKGISFNASASLSSARLIANLGRYGTIDARFSGSGGLSTKSLPAPCKGPKFQTRDGNLSGFSFNADTTFFRKVSERSLDASLSRQPASGQIKCGTGSGGGGIPKPKPGELSLSAFGAGGQRLSMVASKKPSGEVAQTVYVVDQAAAPASAVVHAISATAPSSSFTAAGDLKSARVNGAGAFLSGTASFSAQAAYGKVATGKLSGSYRAKFDSIGPKGVAGLPATLAKT
jgi:hypothetical protein